MKKGLSNIVNLSRGTVSSSSSEVNAKKIKLAAAVASTTKAQVLQSSLSTSLKKKTPKPFYCCSTKINSLRDSLKNNALQKLIIFLGKKIEKGVDQTRIRTQDLHITR